MKRFAWITLAAVVTGCAANPEPAAPSRSTPAPAAASTPAAVAAPSPADPGPAPSKPSESPSATPVPASVINPAAVSDTSPSVLPAPDVAPAPTPAAAPIPAVAPAPSVAPAPAIAPAPATAAPAAPAKEIIPFEVAKDGKTYVFATIDAMTAFTNNGTAQPMALEKPNLAPSGATVVIEAANAAQAEQLTAGYVKLHPKAAK